VKQVKTNKLFNLLIVMVIALSACTWVEITEKGKNVNLKTNDVIAACKLMGETTVYLRDKIIGINRSKESVQEELQTLARNSAAKMGGDSIVANSEINEGRQAFNVYRCSN
jgi:hypothetical protein